MESHLYYQAPVIAQITTTAASVLWEYNPAAVVDIFKTKTKSIHTSRPTPDKLIPPPDEKYTISASFVQFQWTLCRHGPWRTLTQNVPLTDKSALWCGHIARRIYWLDVKTILRVKFTFTHKKNQTSEEVKLDTRGGTNVSLGASFLIGTMIKHRFKRFHKGSWHIWHCSPTLTVVAGSSDVRASSFLQL